MWVPPGTDVTVQGQPLAGGMLYVGTTLTTPRGIPDPALIDPSLRVDHRRPDRAGESMGYWPSYSDISPQARAAYLAWLAGGRRDPKAYIGYVFLYFYGIERRLLLESDRSSAEERVALLDEVRRLLDMYSRNKSFAGYATRLLEVMADPVLDWVGKHPPEPPAEHTYELPADLRIGLGQHIARGVPIPVDWAFAWYRGHPNTYPRTPAIRCPDEFRAMFAHLYQREYGAGLRLKRNKTTIKTTYHAASSTIGTVTVVDSGLPDVAGLTAPIEKLRDLAEKATDALDAYSRYLGRYPDRHGSPAALALLPDDLTPPPSPETDAVWAWATARLADAPDAVVPTADLVAHWPGAAAKLAKADAVLVARLLEKRGIGIEPDVRFGGGTPAPNGSVVLFRRGREHVATPSPDYSLAQVAVNLGAAVAIADGTVTEPERQAIRDYAVTTLDLTEDELRRLDAHVALVLANPPTQAVLKRRLAAVPQPDRTAVAGLLTDIAAADGDVSVHEVRTLERLYAFLGLDSADVYGRIHGRATTRGDEPIALRVAGTPAQRVPIPAEAARPATSGVGLDLELLARKRAESQRVAEQLAQIFTDDEPAPPPPVPAAQLAGLDAEHTEFLRRLVGRPQWARADLEDLATEVGLLLDGALDTVNEAAFDTVGDPVWEGTDPITINEDVAEDMRS
ncbi:TerB N-terminal domain-containing protein [Actinokineospora enzanensis]|uniref:tellurite resistance TerB family protein n=1 Tax=Actinokineospora enzanensis TaxID=155975 RepID=UPI0003A05B55|nr:TerB N-terminal domain-containing protein [Actinokineospora enzanensis]